MIMIKKNKRILRYSSHACVFHIPLLVYLFVSQNKSLNTTEYCDTRTHAMCVSYTITYWYLLTMNIWYTMVAFGHEGDY